MTLTLRFVLLLVLFVASCSSLSGYDPNRYATTPSPAAGATDPETEPLPQTTRKQKMLDPRSPVDGGVVAQ